MIAVPPEFMDIKIHLIYAYNGAHRQVLISQMAVLPKSKRATFTYVSDALSPTAHSLAEGDTLLLPSFNRLILSQNNIFVKRRAQNKYVDIICEKLYNLFVRVTFFHFWCHIV